MASTNVWRALMTSLRYTARNPAGPVKPTISGGRADSSALYGIITWEGEAPPRPTGFMCEHLPGPPPGHIKLSLRLDGDQVLYSINIHIGPFGSTRQGALYREADIQKLESLVEHLRELAKWL